MPIQLLLIVSSMAELLLRRETVLASLGIDFCIAQEGELLGCVDISHLLDEALGEDDVDLLQGTVLGLWVEEVDDGQEASVDCGEEEVCAC